MLHRKLGKSTVAAITCLVLLSITSLPLLAATPHEDPDAAKLVFSGVSLLRYYADSLDFVLSRNPTEVEARMSKMSFASLPPGLAEASDSFAASSTNISQRVVWIDADLGKMRVLVQQFRLDEAKELSGRISDNLSLADSELNQIEQATKTTGVELAVSAAPASSNLRSSYDEVLAKIDRIRQMLALYQNLLTELKSIAGQFKPTDITLEIQPRVAFVGDNISFEGVLTAGQKPLAGREVNILINGSQNITAMMYDYMGSQVVLQSVSQNITATTDANGHYQGVLQVPYWYMPELHLQALYYPRDKDIGLYLASLSPVVKLNVLFYEASLAVNLEDKAYPGLTTVVSGRFDYGQSPPPDGRRVEIYLDDVLITEFVAREVFAQKIKIDAATYLGRHTITVSAAAAGRYAPVVTNAILNVIRATPILDLTLPSVALIPGSVRLEGKLYSEVGPLSGALIKMRLSNSQVEITSSENGTFDTKIKVGLGLGMVGWQDVAIQVLPQDTWHAPFNTTSSVLMVNVLNIGGFLAVLVFLGVYLPRRLKRRLGAYPGRTVRPATTTTPPEPVPVSSYSVSLSAAASESEPDSGEASNRIFSWYRLVVRFLLRIAKIPLRPQQTMREFADEHSRVLGPGAKYFNELTGIVERLLYSRYRPTETDVEHSRQLSLKVEAESKLEVDAFLTGGEGGLAEESIHRVEGLEVGGRVLMLSPWRQASTWLWVLLIMTVAYFACLLLFLLPLLAAGYR